MAGLKAVALTDIIQVVLLILGGLMIAYVSLNQISDGEGALSGFAILLDQIPEKFDMILSKDSPHYANLPGISVLIGGMWVMNLSYWGFNQYIIQRALAAKNNREAQKGIVFAAFLKMLVPVLVVLPGIAAVVLAPDLPTPDSAYPEVMKLLPVGIKGLVFAALIAAIVSSLASMTNSISTIFTMDIYANLAGSEKSENHLVTVGRIVSFSSLVIAMIVSRPLLGNFDQAFQYIQEFTGFFTPGIVAIFLLAIFWRATTANGALGAAVGSAVLSLGFKLFWPSLPFIDRVGTRLFTLCGPRYVDFEAGRCGRTTRSDQVRRSRLHHQHDLQLRVRRHHPDAGRPLRNLVVGEGASLTSRDICRTRPAVGSRYRSGTRAGRFRGPGRGRRRGASLGPAASSRDTSAPSC